MSLIEKLVEELEESRKKKEAEKAEAEAEEARKIEEARKAESSLEIHTVEPVQVQKIKTKKPVEVEPEEELEEVEPEEVEPEEEPEEVEPEEVEPEEEPEEIESSPDGGRGRDLMKLILALGAVVGGAVAVEKIPALKKLVSGEGSNSNPGGIDVAKTFGDRDKKSYGQYAKEMNRKNKK
ncbi:hypothetical protein ES703_77944 [subsurface metagenome]